jgi:hypothetical protein
MMRGVLPFLLVAAGFWGPVQAEVRAVLVGVSDYLLLDADLKGPGADVGLVAEVLMARGVAASQIVTLASGAAQPDRAGIMAALDAVAARSGPGDTVVFYFSGHGGQAPDASGDEGGGWDEILLPSDAAGWKGSIGAVENAILDDELQVWAQGLLSRGVQVVGLIDACHSDTGFRAAGGVGVARGLGAEALGIPGEAVSGLAGPELSGDFVFLYSSQSDQRSFEVPVGTDGLWHGAFTLALAEVLRTAPGASWAQVLTATSTAMLQGPVPQQPGGEGPLLQAAVFGQVLFGQVGPQRFALTGGVVQAGLLQGLAEGAEVAFYAQPAGGNALGATQLGAVSAREARVQGAVPAAAQWIEVTAPAPAVPLRLAAAVVAKPGDHAAWLRVLGPGEAGGDLVPVLTGGDLALTGADGVLDPYGAGSSPRVVPERGETHAQALARVLEAAAHALRLRQLFAAVAGRSLTGKPALEVAWQRKAATVQGQDCGVAAAAEAVDPGAGVQPCDQLWLRLRNSSGKDLDVSVLYFGADFSVSGVWPRRGLSNRLASGESARAGMQIDPGSVGMDEVILLAVPVDPDADRVDLTRLADPAMGRAFAGASAPVEGWFEDRMRGDAVMRGFSSKPPAMMMIRQTVRVLPRG